MAGMREVGASGQMASRRSQRCSAARCSGDAVATDSASARGAARLAHAPCHHKLGAPTSGDDHGRTRHMASILQFRVEASLHPIFADEQWASPFRDCFARLAGHGAVSFHRAEELVISLRAQSESSISAMFGPRAPAWAGCRAFAFGGALDATTCDTMSLVPRCSMQSRSPQAGFFICLASPRLECRHLGDKLRWKRRFVTGRVTSARPRRRANSPVQRRGGRIRAHLASWARRVARTATELLPRMRPRRRR